MLIAFSDKNKEIVNNIFFVFICLSVLGKFSNFFLQYKAAAVRAVYTTMKNNYTHKTSLGDNKTLRELINTDVSAS